MHECGPEEFRYEADSGLFLAVGHLIHAAAEIDHIRVWISLVLQPVDETERNASQIHLLRFSHIIYVCHNSLWLMDICHAFTMNMNIRLPGNVFTFCFYVSLEFHVCLKAKKATHEKEYTSCIEGAACRDTKCKHPAGAKPLVWL